LLVLALGLMAFAPFSAQARPIAPGNALPQILLLSPVGSFNQPTYVTGPPGDQHRLFVVEKPGMIRLVLDGVVQSTYFLDIHDMVASNGEQGLLSMAFPQDYDTSGLFYVAYTAAGTWAVTVDEYQRDPNNPNVANPASRRNVITIPHPGETNHNGGQIEFGPDGMLYIGVGDGGSEGDPHRYGQNLQVDLAKILRIDPRGVGDGDYRIPPNNPFVGRHDANREIWSYGVRNPWRFSFDRTTGDLTMGDVGQDAWEEIDYRPVDLGWGFGANFGWSCFEGRHPYNTCSPPPPNPIPPVFEISHDTGACSVIGGYVVRDPELTTLQGQYLYTDLCLGHIHAQTLQIPNSVGHTDTGLTVSNPSTFGEDGCGHLYVAGLGSGNNVFRIRQTDPPPPDCPPAFPLPVLTADVNDNFTIHLRDPNGQDLNGGTLPEGSYRLEVDDNSEDHNFHLLRPLSTVSVPSTVSCVPSGCATDVQRTGHQTWIVNFTPGTVRYQCDPHAPFMFGTFTVTGTGARH